MPIIPNQISLHGWSIEFFVPIDRKADFLLAVIAPKTPSISPIPITQTISASLFSVIVMDSSYGIGQEGRDFKTVKNIEEVKTEFSEFISSIGRQNNC